MKRSMQAALLLMAAVASYQVGTMASGSSLPSMPARTMTPEERAIEAYNNGLQHRDKGKKAEEQRATAKEADQPKLEKKAREEFEKALKDFSRARDLNPKLYQAYNGMGFAYRKLGDHTKALEFYDQALAMAPGFPEATEYRGEAYLGLNRIDDAKEAYLELFGSDRKEADALMAAMKTWVTARRANAGGVDAAAISAFEAWINERAQTAKLTASMALDANRHGW